MINLFPPRVTCGWGIATADTFRNRSRALMGYWGTNLQNIPDSLRRLVIPDPWKILLQADQAGAEALIVAYLCRDGNFRALFKNGIKSHVYVALNIFREHWKKSFNHVDAICSLPIAEIPKHYEWPALSKAIKSHDKYYFIGKKTCHCVDAETEVLTRDGWKNIIKVAEETKESIAIFDPKLDEIRFDNVFEWNTYQYDGELIVFETKSVLQKVTEDHKILYLNNNVFKSMSAAAVYQCKCMNLVTSSNYIGGKSDISDTDIRLLVAIQADGHIATDQVVHFNFVKERKKDRLEMLLKQGNYNYKLIWQRK